MRLERGESNLEHVVRPASCVEDGAAAAGAMRVDQVVDRGIEPGFRQRLRHQGPLPITVARRREMLQRAAAARSEMRADRCDAVGAGAVDLDEMATVGVTGPLIDFRDLTRQRVGHVERARGRVRHAVAAGAESGDREALHHGPSIAGVRGSVQRPD